VPYVRKYISIVDTARYNPVRLWPEKYGKLDGKPDLGNTHNILLRAVRCMISGNIAISERVFLVLVRSAVHILKK